MKFAIIAALLCVAVVSAAPPTPSEMAEELTFGPFNVVDKVKELYERMRCAFDIAGKVVSEDHQLEQVFEHIKTKIDNLMNVEWKKCDSTGNKFEVLKCKTGVVLRLGEVFANFIQEVYNTNREMAERIRELVQTQCRNRYELFELDQVEEITFDPFYTIVDEIKKYFELAQCAFEVIGQVTGDDKELRKEFENIKIAIESLMKVEWKKCDNAENKHEVLKCKLTVIGKLATAFGKFVQRINDINLEMAKKLEEQLTKCFKN